MNLEEHYILKTSQFLEEAQKKFGTKLEEYIFEGIEYHDKGPTIWYPKKPKTIKIHLTKSTLSSQIQGVFQLSHEVVHLLSPNGKSVTNNLEEGLAVYFSIEITNRESGNLDYAMNSILQSNYLESYRLVDKLLQTNPDSIKILREVQPVLALLTKDDFIKSGLNLESGFIDDLVKEMKY
jgi:hypothetical protein